MVLPIVLGTVTSLKIQNRLILDKPVADVWKALCSPELVAKCVPGFEIDGKVDDNHYRARGRVSVGFISARFDELQVTKRVLEDGSIVEYEISGEDSRKLGSLLMKMVVALRVEEGAKTSVQVDSDLEITGKFAALGTRIVEPKYKKIVEETVENFHNL